MDGQVDALERLTALRSSGALSEAEFEAQKARLLATGSNEQEFAAEARPERTGQFGKAWEERFAFFDAHGSPFSTSASHAMRDLGFWERGLLLFNPWAFLFGILYFLFIGIPKRGIGLIGLAIILECITYKLTGSLTSPVTSIVIECLFAFTANYYRYIKVRQGRDEWSPFKDLVPQ